MEAVKLWEDGLWAVHMASQSGGRLLGEGIGLVSLVSRELLERLVGEEGLHVCRTGCFVGSVSFLGLDQRFSAGSLHRDCSVLRFFPFSPGSARHTHFWGAFMLTNLIFTPVL